MIAKYVVTPNLEIIIFSSNVTHRLFYHLNPISAGFVRFMIHDGKVTCECFGESESLHLKSNETLDTKLANRYLLCENCVKCGNCEGRCKNDEFKKAV